jgi:putative endonuclease
MDRIQQGRKAEKLVQKFLQKNGYKILETNFRIGGSEIDIIAKKKDTICFVEVRSKKAAQGTTPVESINKIKRSHLIRAASLYIQRYGIHEQKIRFDVAGIEWGKKKPLCYIENAFET